MRKDLVEIVCCPVHKTPLLLTVREQDAHGDIVEGLALLAAVVGLSLGLVYLNVKFNSWYNDFYNAIQEKRARKVGATQEEPVDVHRVLDSVTQMAASTVRARAKLVKEYGDLPAVWSTESRVGQVFLNDVDEAILGDTLYFATLDAHLVALDVATGKVRWDVTVAAGSLRGGPSDATRFFATHIRPNLPGYPYRCGDEADIRWCGRDLGCACARALASSGARARTTV